MDVVRKNTASLVEDINLLDELIKTKNNQINILEGMVKKYYTERERLTAALQALAGQGQHNAQVLQECAKVDTSYNRIRGY